MNARSKVFLYGAYGHTGRFVAAELKRRRIRMVLSGRDHVRLAQMAEDDDTVLAARIEAASELSSAIAGCVAILNCAGPFADTADALIEQALRLRIPYLDVTGETDVAAHVFSTYGQRAKEAGVAILPSTGFYGALGALLVRAAAGDWGSADDVAIAIGLDGWKPTPGTRAVIQRVAGKRLIFAGGALRECTNAPTFAPYRFPPPFDEQTVMHGYSSPEGVLLPQRLATPAVKIMMTVAALRDLRNPETPPPPADYCDGSSAQRFLLDAVVTKGTEQRRASASGKDIYATTAPILVSALESVIGAPFQAGGVFSLSDITEPAAFLRSIRAREFVVNIDGR